jgi:histidinol-phosphate aminotransferase
MTACLPSGDVGGIDLDHHGDQDLDPEADGQLDLAVNVRPGRPPDWLRARLHAALDGLAAYPRQEAAVAAVAARHRRQPDEVLLTNGAAEAFTLIARTLRPRHPVCVHPSFTAPEAALRKARRDVGRVLLPEPFGLAAADVPAAADLVVLGNPTNPTGLLHPAPVVAELARPGRVLVVDEAFADAVPGEPATLSARRDLPGLLVVRSLTKTWGLAGLRVGYLLGEPALIAALREGQPPWAVNSLALAALQACSQAAAVAWARQQAERVAGWRIALSRALDRIPGVAVAPGGQAPFLLLKVGDAATVRHRLRGLGIAVRRGDTFPGLDGQWLRIAVVGPGHHQRIADAFACATSPSVSCHDRMPIRQVPSEPAQRLSIPAGPAAPHAIPAGPAPAHPGPVARTAPRPSPAGTVTLIGAGPGGPDLITMRGWQALHSADVVVADRLADPALAAGLRPGVLLICAGKEPGAHQLSQQQINDILIEHASAGRTVARLKGGDPFVLGRGGEEAAACAAAGVSWSVVPGLSSATAAPALAGIPLTQREIGQSFTVVPGHLPPGHPDNRVNWPAVADGADTLVLLMAVRNLRAIAERLIAVGRAGATPAACVESAATPSQRIRRCTLAELAAGELTPGLTNPAVIIVGPTAGAIPTGQ